jgi:hypothetical protein
MASGVTTRTARRRAPTAEHALPRELRQTHSWTPGFKGIRPCHGR